MVEGEEIKVYTLEKWGQWGEGKRYDGAGELDLADCINTEPKWGRI